MAKCNEGLTCVWEGQSEMSDIRCGMEFYTKVQEAFEKAILSVGKDGLKATSMFLRNERIAGGGAKAAA